MAKGPSENSMGNRDLEPVKDTYECNQGKTVRRSTGNQLEAVAWVCAMISRRMTTSA